MRETSHLHLLEHAAHLSNRPASLLWVIRLSRSRALIYASVPASRGSLQHGQGRCMWGCVALSRLAAALALQHRCAPARHARPSVHSVQVRYGDRFVEELHLPVEVLSFESDLPGSSGPAPRDLPSAAPETPASEGDGRLAHASPLPWNTPPQEVGAWPLTGSSRHLHAAPLAGAAWLRVMLAILVMLQACVLACSTGPQHAVRSPGMSAAEAGVGSITAGAIPRQGKSQS